MRDFVDGTAFNFEQGQRSRKLFAAVVLAALDDAIADDKKYGNGPEQIARWARSRDGREVLSCAGIDPNERVVKGLMESHGGTIAIDSIFTPIKNVKYTVENTRVEEKTDYEKLTIEVVSDGSISPKNALQEAAKILIHHFMLFSDERISLEVEERGTVSESDEFDETSLHMRQLLKTKLVDMDLSVRALNCLKAADIETLGDLVSFNKNDLLKFRNFGKKSLTELEDLVENKGLSFGMNVSKYKLDKE